MIADAPRKWRWICLLLLVILIGASACGKPRGKDRPCYPYFDYLFPEPNIFGEDTVMTSPDWDVSVYSNAHPKAICHASYTFRRGHSGINFYEFDNVKDAETGFQNLAEYSTSINKENFAHLEPPEIAGAAPYSDELSMGCISSKRESLKICYVTARYGTRVYYARITIYNETRELHKYVPTMIEALDAKLMIGL